MASLVSNHGWGVADQPRTKLIATLGPACRSPDMLRAMIENGVDVFRLNMAHGKAANHDETIRDIRAASDDVGRPVGILVDLAGPKIRLGQLLTDPMPLEMGQSISFVRGNVSSVPNEFTCTYEAMIDEVSRGEAVVLADGVARLEVVSKTADRLDCVVTDGGTIRSRQGVNLPSTHLSVAALGDIDRENAVWAAKAGVEFVSLSFVRCAAELIELRLLIQKHGGTSRIVAKIEKREALDNLDEIVEATDCVMVARGDLGVEIDIAKTPLAQKRIIRACGQAGKPVIVATQMLESMHHSKQPTRAEVSDVANAILDGADACMLSGESAIGDFPLDAVNMMKRIMYETEQNLRHRSSRMQTREGDSGWGMVESVMLGVAQIARRLGAQMVVIVSTDQRAALVKSKQRDFVPTAFLSDNVASVRQMCLYWGIIPVQIEGIDDIQKLPSMAMRWASNHAGLKQGDRIVMVLDNELLPGVHDTVMIAEIP